MKKVICSLLFIFFCLGATACDKDNGIDPKKLESLYVINQSLFVDVKEIINKKRIELNSDNITINDKLEKNRYGMYRVFIALNRVKSKWKEKLTDIFTEKESEKIERIFSMGFIYIESAEDYSTFGSRCSFAEQGFLDCHNEILFAESPNKFENFIKNDDDEIIKKLGANWYIYGMR